MFCVFRFFLEIRLQQNFNKTAYLGVTQKGLFFSKKATISVLKHAKQQSS